MTEQTELTLEYAIFQKLQMMAEQSALIGLWTEEDLRRISEDTVREWKEDAGVQCWFCKEPFASDDTEQIWEQVTTWVGGKKKDSATLRVRTGKRAHGRCVGKERSGQAPDQDSVFDESSTAEPPVVADEENFF